MIGLSAIDFSIPKLNEASNKKARARVAAGSGIGARAINVFRALLLLLLYSSKNFSIRPNNKEERKERKSIGNFSNYDRFTLARVLLIATPCLLVRLLS